MMRSLTSAVGGLRSHQTRMDVIGNNIANVNTYGFKSSRVTFSDVYYQTLSGGSKPVPDQMMGGTNPTQIGYGAAVATIDVLNSPSGQVGTDRALDIYIAGDGMIVTEDSSGVRRYTRLGVLGFDAEGYLVDSNGYYVLGFPVDDATGNPIIGSNGYVDSGDLDRIFVKKEMLDMMTGVSIGTRGEIIGVMPGDTEAKVSNSRPSWLYDIQIPADSDLTGEIKVFMEYQATSSSPMPASWVTNVEAMPNMGIDGNYVFEYDTANSLITARDTTTGVLYTGAYRRGDEIKLVDSKGDVAFVVTTDNFDTPVGSAMGTMSFTSEQVIRMEATDKGGNKVKDEFRNYNGVQSSVKIGDITLIIDPDEAKDVRNAEFKFDYATMSTPGHDYEWLLSAQIDGNSASADGDVTLLAGKNYVASTNVSQGNTALNWMDKGNLEAILADWCEYGSTPLGYTGEFEIEYIPNGTDWDIDIRTKPASGPSQSVMTITNAVAAAATAFDYTLNDGTVLSLFNTPFTGVSAAATQSLGKVAAQNTIRAVDDAGNTIGSAIYSSESVITLGDLSITVDPTKLKAFFDTGGAGNIGMVSHIIGEISHPLTKDWIFSGQVATARAADGEKIVVGNIAAAKIPNMVGMTQDGKGYFMVSPNSGDAKYTLPGLNGTGQTIAGYLEMSNVDISKEFTDMITTQRGFQANTRIITVSDEMLAELVNLKR